MKVTNVSIEYHTAMRVKNALEDAKTELETIETQIDWYSCFGVIDKLERSIEEMEMAISEANA